MTCFIIEKLRLFSCNNFFLAILRLYSPTCATFFSKSFFLSVNLMFCHIIHLIIDHRLLFKRAFLDVFQLMGLNGPFTGWPLPDAVVIENNLDTNLSEGYELERKYDHHVSIIWEFTQQIRPDSYNNAARDLCGHGWITTGHSLRDLTGTGGPKTLCEHFLF